MIEPITNDQQLHPVHQDQQRLACAKYALRRCGERSLRVLVACIESWRVERCRTSKP